ncbi:hypothetical protein AgCh_032066 [Apium graveolens]
MDQDEGRREQNREEDREQDREQSSEELVKKRSRGPTLCKDLKRRIAKQNLDCSISFNEYGEPIGDMLKDFITYVGSVVRFQVDINIESWDLVNQDLKDAIWEDIKTRWKLDDSRKKNVLERAGKQWRDFKGKLNKNYFREGKDPARARADGQGGHYFPNKKTKDVCLTMNELHNQASEGSWTPQGHDDLLARALGNKEHGGRVRGVGGGVKIKDVFKSGPRRHSGLVSTDELATITEEIKKKVQKECEEMMNSKLEGIFNQLKQMGVSLEADQFVNDAERGKVVAARGTLFPTNQGEMIHNNPIAPQNVRVSVDDVITEYQLTPLPVPCYEHETIGNAAGSFVQWPKDLVMLGQDPILEKKKLQEMMPIQKSSKVESKGSVTPLKQSPQVVGDDINSSEHCAGLSFLLKKRPPSKKSDAFVFEENGDGPIYITLEDVNQFLRMSWLNIPIVELFVKYVSKLCKQLKDDKFAFMLPSRLAIPHNHEQQKRKDEATDYMTSLLVANKDKRYILAPYIQEDHWMLLLFCLNESAIYVFDSLKKERKIRLTTPARMAFKLYVPQGGLKNNRKEFIWHHTEVQGMVLGDTRRECRTITRSLDIIKNRVSLRDLS